MRHFLLSLFLFCATLSAQAQDTILRTNGDEVKARVLAITPTDVAYVPITEPLSTDTLHLLATEVFLIRYANGTKEILHDTTAVASAVGLLRTAQEMNNQGREDARKYFKAPGAFWGTLGATVVSLPIVPVLGGLAAGIAMSATPPRSQNLIVPDKALLADVNYMRGYEKQAQRRKIGKAAAGFGVGMVGTAVLVGILLANTKHF